MARIPSRLYSSIKSGANKDLKYEEVNRHVAIKRELKTDVSEIAALLARK
jgi:hypothetical protein